MRFSQLGSVFALVVVASASVACSTETDAVESNEPQKDADDDGVKVEVSTDVEPQAVCATSCTCDVGSVIACNLTSPTATKAAYTCRNIFGTYKTGCVTNRGASYCSPYL